MTTPETGRQRAARIPLDYFRHGDALERGKVWLTLGAAGVAALWWLSGYVPRVGGEKRYSRGPVAEVHATWDASCDACHMPFHPVRQRPWLASFVSLPAPGERCETCHRGPPHHENQQWGDHERSCADCHLEHRGREASLVRLADSDCTICHANLEGHIRTGANKKGFASGVTAFALERHPEFRAVQAPDPGRLKFNHKRHLTAGMPLVPGAQRLRLSDIDPRMRQSYRLAQNAHDDSEPVQLNCASCHQLDAQAMREAHPHAPAAALPPVRSAGAYLLPVTYDNQCRACHPLTVDPRKPDGLRVPHHLQPAEVHRFLSASYVSLALEANPALAERPLPPRPRPDQHLETEVASARARVEERVTKAERILFQGNGGCSECHTYLPEDGPFPSRTIEPTRVPEVWMPHARFNHTAHRAVECLQCHAHAIDSQTARDVLIPGINTCLDCHAPRTGSGSTARGGARADCVECHRYHLGDEPLAGAGSGRGAPARLLSINALLSADGRAPQTATTQPAKSHP